MESLACCELRLRAEDHLSSAPLEPLDMFLEEGGQLWIIIVFSILFLRDLHKLRLFFSVAVLAEDGALLDFHLLPDGADSARSLGLMVRFMDLDVFLDVIVGLRAL